VAEQQGHHTQLHLAEAGEEDRHLKEREVETGCTVETACQAGSEVADQSLLGLGDWDDGEDRRWGSRRVLQVVAQTLLGRRVGSCRMVFAVRWEVGVRHPFLKVQWERSRA
jgi:hypothetical protein